MKVLMIFVSIISVAIAQRPTYAGISSKGYPELASRFRDPADNQDENIVNSVAVGNRIGAGDDQPAQNLPTDARGDGALVNRFNQWPRENRPFWLINAEHLERHRHPNGTAIGQQQNLNTIQNRNQQRLDEIQPTLGGNQQGFTQDQQDFGFTQQQGLNRDQQTFQLSQQDLNRDPQTFGINQQPVIGVQPNRGQTGQVQSRFGEPIATETRTIKPLSQRGSFAGGRK